MSDCTFIFKHPKGQEVLDATNLFDVAYLSALEEQDVAVVIDDNETVCGNYAGTDITTGSIWVSEATRFRHLSAINDDSSGIAIGKVTINSTRIVMLVAPDTPPTRWRRLVTQPIVATTNPVAGENNTSAIGSSEPLRSSRWKSLWQQMRTPSVQQLPFIRRATGAAPGPIARPKPNLLVWAPPSLPLPNEAPWPADVQRRTVVDLVTELEPQEVGPSYRDRRAAQDEELQEWLFR